MFIILSMCLIGSLLGVLIALDNKDIKTHNSKLSSRLLDEKVQEKYKELVFEINYHPEEQYDLSIVIDETTHKPLIQADLVYNEIRRGYQIVFIDSKKEKSLFSKSWLSAEEMIYYIDGFIKGLKFTNPIKITSGDKDNTIKVTYDNKK
jgi:hypothetical protein